MTVPYNLVFNLGLVGFVTVIVAGLQVLYFGWNYGNGCHGKWNGGWVEFSYTDTWKGTQESSPKGIHPKTHRNLGTEIVHLRKSTISF